MSIQFRKLISSLKKGEANLKKFHLANDPEIINGASLEKANSNEISFLEDGNKLNLILKDTNACAVLVHDNPELLNTLDKIGIAYASFQFPRIAFAETLEILHPKQEINYGIHSTATIYDRRNINELVQIGANTFIGRDVVISENSVIHPGVVIHENVKIGMNCELHSNCVIHSKVEIGDNCIINSNAVIGGEGFGFVPTQKGWRKMPQTGIVVLENDVEIGSNTSVDRPAVGETRIGKGTKIDNLVQIGHGVKIGSNCAMASQVGIAGGAIIGNGVILAGQVGVGNRVNVGDNVIASSKCGIHTDIEPGEVVSGFPALPNRLWLRCSASFKKLPEMFKKLKEIESGKT